jgi:transcriptional regulator with XRE-family HTH domain
MGSSPNLKLHLYKQQPECLTVVQVLYRRRAPEVVLAEAFIRIITSVRLGVLMGSVLRPDGSRIRALRVKKGWPQEQLAQIAGVNACAIRRVEVSGDASFETLRSIASAFGLQVHELMRESGKTTRDTGQFRVRLAATYAPVLSFCLPYAPAFKGLMGSFVLVLLAASTICLSPLLLDLDSKTPTAEFLPTTTLPSTSVLAGMNFQQPVRVQTDATAAGGKLRRVVRFIKPVRDEVRALPAPAQVSSVPSNAAIPHDSGWAQGVLQAPEAKTENPVTAGGIDIGWLASLSEPEPAQPAGRTAQHSLQPTAVADARMSVPQIEQGTAELAPRGSQGGFGLVIEPFRRTGKGTAVLFTKVGSSIKRIF